MVHVAGVTFPSVEQRNDVRDAVLGYAEARDGETDEEYREIELLFLLGQPLLYLENNEPAMRGTTPVLNIGVAFEDEDELGETIEFLTAQPDDDLTWFGETLQESPAFTEDDMGDSKYMIPPVKPYMRHLRVPQ